MQQNRQLTNYLNIIVMDLAVIESSKEKDMTFKYLGILVVSAGLCAHAFADYQCPPNWKIHGISDSLYYHGTYGIYLYNFNFKSAKVKKGTGEKYTLECRYASDDGGFVTAADEINGKNCGFKSTGSTLSKDCTGAKPDECKVQCE